MELIKEIGKILEDVSHFIPNNVFKVCELFNNISEFVQTLQTIADVVGVNPEKDDGFNLIRSQYIPVFSRYRTKNFESWRRAYADEEKS